MTDFHPRSPPFFADREDLSQSLSERRTVRDFTVATYNIRTASAISDGRNAWWLRRRATVEVVESLHAAVVGLQEVRPIQLSYLRRHLPQYQVLSAGRNNGRNRGEHCTVLVDLAQFVVLDWRVRWFSPTPDVPGSRYEGAAFPRIGTFVHLTDKQSRAEFMFVNLHLDHRSHDARGQAALDLCREAENSRLPWIIVGDFNVNVDDPALAPLWKAGFVDALAPLPPRGPNTATHHNFTGRLDGDRIDHILLRPPISIIEAYIDFKKPYGRFASDHWPVVAKVHLE